MAVTLRLVCLAALLQGATTARRSFNLYWLGAAVRSSLHERIGAVRLGKETETADLGEVPVEDDKHFKWRPWRRWDPLTASPAEIWYTLGRTGRHGWRSRQVEWPANFRFPETEEQAKAKSRFDWSMLLVVTFLLAGLQLLLCHFPSTMVLHGSSLGLYILVGLMYSLAIYFRNGSGDTTLWTTGYLLELINMVENIFVFHSIARGLRTPREHGRKAILIVLFFQVAFQLVFFLKLFSWLRHLRVLPYILGAWLMCMGAWLCCHSEEESPDHAVPDGQVVKILQRCLGDRFWAAYDQDGNLFARKQGVGVVTMLGPVVAIFIILDFFLEVDVTLTKIEEIPDQYSCLSSSMLASFCLPDMFFVAGSLFQRFSVFKYGIAAIIAIFGLEMLASSFFVVPAVWNCYLMVGVVLICVIMSLLYEEPTCNRALQGEDRSSAEAEPPDASPESEAPAAGAT